MKKDYTDIIVIQDRSGSMENIKDDMVNGLKNFIAEQKRLPGQCLLTLIQFDTQSYDTVFTGKPIAEVSGIELVPRGGTPLLDAIGRTINETGDRFKKLADADRPEFVIVLIITDGQENSSHEFTKAKIKEMIEHQTAKYKWNFTYLGANQDAFSEAQSMGIDVASALQYKANSQGTMRMFDSVNYAATALRSHTVGTMAYNKSDYDAQDKS